MPPPHRHGGRPLSRWEIHERLSKGNELQSRPTHTWTVVRKLGAENRGALNGGVYIVKDRKGKRHIEKRSKRELVDNGMVLQEITILKYLSKPSHKHITKMVDYFVDRKRSEASIYLERCEIGGLETLIDSRVQSGQLFNEIDVWEWFIQLFDALTYCHYGPDPKARFKNTKPEDWKNSWDMVFHRDIKVENILVTNGTPRGQTTKYTLKLADFGCAVARRHIWVDRFNDRTQQSFATRGWMPPESPQFVGRSDVWQLAGVVACNSNVMHMPFFDHAKPAPGYSTALNNAIAESMKNDWKKRPKSDEVLEHVRVKYAKMLKELQRSASPVPPGVDLRKREKQIQRGHKRLQAEALQEQLAVQGFPPPGNAGFGGGMGGGVSSGFRPPRMPPRGVIGRQGGRRNIPDFGTRSPSGYYSDDNWSGGSGAYSPRYGSRYGGYGGYDSYGSYGSYDSGSMHGGHRQFVDSDDESDGPPFCVPCGMVHDWD